MASCSTAVNDALVSWLSQRVSGSDGSAEKNIRLQYPVVDHLQRTDCSFDALSKWARCLVARTHCARVRASTCAHAQVPLDPKP